MDLLGGYGSDSSSEGDEPQQPAATATRPPSTTATSALKTAAAAAPSVSSSKKIRRKGKRLVSLHAILPKHILDQLERGAEDDEYDSDEELLGNQQNTGDSHMKPPAPATTVHHEQADSEISSFLSDLHAAPTAAPFLNSASDSKPHAVSASSSEPLGAAFTTTTITNVTKKKGQPTEITDIHAPKSQPQTTKKPAPLAPAPQPLAPAPRPTAATRPVVAAPPVSSASAYASAVSHHPQQHMSAPPAPTHETTATARSKKRSRQDMQKALRSGNFAALDETSGDVNVVETTQPAYQPQEETYQVDTSNVVKVAPIQMYDPSKGTDVTAASVTSKQRSKHQINQLLANAASLELQRARNMGGGTTHSKRADAKRKYGW